MSKMEKIVRPFELDEAARARSIPTEQSAKADPVVLRSGRNGGGKQFNANLSDTMTLFCEAHKNEERSEEPNPNPLEETKRKTHMKRYWANEDPESETFDKKKNKDNWVDIQRIDKVEFEGGQGPDYVKETYKFDWNKFDETLEEPNANKNRKIKKVKVKNPEDEDQFIMVPVIEKIDVLREWGKTYDTHKHKGAPKPGSLHIARTFKVPEDGEEKEQFSRTTDDRTVKHRDLKNNAEPEGGDNSVGLFADGVYVFKDLTEEGKDDSSKVVFEYPKAVSFKDGQGPSYKYVTENFKNKYLVDLADPIDISNEAEVQAEPVRLDPFQNIVNVQWFPDYISITVGVQASHTDPPSTINYGTGAPEAFGVHSDDAAWSNGGVNGVELFSIVQDFGGPETIVRPFPISTDPQKNQEYLEKFTYEVVEWHEPAPPDGGSITELLDRHSAFIGGEWNILERSPFGAVYFPSGGGASDDEKKKIPKLFRDLAWSKDLTAEVAVIGRGITHEEVLGASFTPPDPPPEVGVRDKGATGPYIVAGSWSWDLSGHHFVVRTPAVHGQTSQLKTYRAEFILVSELSLPLSWTGDVFPSSTITLLMFPDHKLTLEA